MKSFEEYLKENDAVQSLTSALFLNLRRRLKSGWHIQKVSTAVAMKDSGPGVEEEAKKAVSNIVKNRGGVVKWKKAKLGDGDTIEVDGAHIYVFDNGDVVKIAVGP